MRYLVEVHALQLRKTRPDWNPKRIYRVYKAMKLNPGRAAKRGLPKREWVALYVPRPPRYGLVMSDALACGRRFRTFNVIDAFNREALHIEVDASINSHRPVRVFEQIKHDRGLPQVVRSERAACPRGITVPSSLASRSPAVSKRMVWQSSTPNRHAEPERVRRTL